MLILVPTLNLYYYLTLASQLQQLTSYYITDDLSLIKMGFCIYKIWQILKRFAGSFYQA